MQTENKIFFLEEQQFRESTVWVIFAATAIISIGIIVVLTMIGEIPNEEAILPLILLTLAYALTFFLFYSAKLDTKINEEGVCFRWLPFFKKYSCIRKEDIISAEVRKRPWMQYGFKFVPGYGKIHYVSGEEGIQFYLKNGKKIFIGTTDTFSFINAIEKLTNIQIKAGTSEF